MSVEVFSEFPASFTAGDTIRGTISDGDHPSTGWTLKVLLQSATDFKSFDTTVGADNDFNLLIAAADSAQIAPGLYAVSYVFVETSTSERESVALDQAVTVYRNPGVTPAKSIARQTLEAMEAAFQKLASGSNLSVSFNGQSFTKRNLKEFQEAIQLQRVIVNSEVSLPGSRSSRILHPI